MSLGESDHSSRGLPADSVTMLELKLLNFSTNYYFLLKSVQVVRFNIFVSKISRFNTMPFFDVLSYSLLFQYYAIF